MRAGSRKIYIIAAIVLTCSSLPLNPVRKVGFGEVLERLTQDASATDDVLLNNGLNIRRHIAGKVKTNHVTFLMYTFQHLPKEGPPLQMLILFECFRLQFVFENYFMAGSKTTKRTFSVPIEDCLKAIDVQEGVLFNGNNKTSLFTKDPSGNKMYLFHQWDSPAGIKATTKPPTFNDYSAAFKTNWYWTKFVVQTTTLLTTSDLKSHLCLSFPDFIEPIKEVYFMPVHDDTANQECWNNNKTKYELDIENHCTYNKSGILKCGSVDYDKNTVTEGPIAKILKVIQKGVLVPSDFEGPVIMEANDFFLTGAAQGVSPKQFNFYPIQDDPFKMCDVPKSMWI